MEVDEIEFQRQVSKFQRVSSNGSTTTTDNSSNPQRLCSNRANLELQNHVEDGVGVGGVARLCGWPSSRIVRVSRASGGKDRHSKVLTSKGLRDRRVRLSVSTAIQFYDLQDRLGYDQPSKAVEWLLKAAASSIDELPSLDPPFLGAISGEKKPEVNHLQAKSKSPACSSTSETSKGSGLSLSRCENRNKARDRAREMAANKKDKEKENDSTRVTVYSFPEGSSFTDLLTGGINNNNNNNINNTTTTNNITSRSPINYIFNHSTQPSQQLVQIPQFNISTGDNNNNNNNNNIHNDNQHHQHHQFSFLQDSFVPAVTTTTGGGGESYNLNFAMTSSSAATGGGVVAPGGFSRGTLQSNLQSTLLPHQHHLQRFQSDGSTATNLPFYIVPNTDHYPNTGGYYGGEGGVRRSDHKEKSKN